jgi:CubicO group peptidase (beta-lactamase class C family)
LLRRSLLPAFKVKPFPPEEVTSINHEAEADPRETGLSRADVDAIWQSVVSLYRSGVEPAVALCIRRHGKVVIDRAIGHLSGNAPGDARSVPKVLAKHDSLYNLYSGSKAVTAMLIHLLDQQGKLHLDDPVAHYIPEFARHGKEGITVRQVLTHRAGLPSVPGVKVNLDLLDDPKLILDVLCDARPIAGPGRRLAYHAVTGGFLLREVAERATGTNLRTLLHREILGPLGFRSFNYGVPPERLSEVGLNAFTGLPALPPYSWMLERSLGVTIREAVTLSNDPRFLTGIVPSGNIIGTADEGSKFFQLLLNGGELDGVRIFEPRTVRRAVAETSYRELDWILGFPVRYGMGFMLGAKVFSVYGPDTTQAYGHLGFSNVVVYADPERDISVSLMTTGKPFLTPEQLYWLNVTRTIARLCPRDRAA